MNKEDFNPCNRIFTKLRHAIISEIIAICVAFMADQCKLLSVECYPDHRKQSFFIRDLPDIAVKLTL